MIAREDKRFPLGDRRRFLALSDDQVREMISARALSPVAGGASAAQTAAPPGQGVNAAPPSAAQPARPFAQASKLGAQQTWQGAVTLAAATNPQIGPVTLTASGGFVRRVILELLTTTAATGAPVLAADAPHNVLSLIRYAEPNNTPILELSGYNLMLADAYGGYSQVNDYRNDPDYSATATGFNLWPFIPIELDPTGLGALSDLSASSGYQLTLQFNSGNVVYSTQPTAYPTISLAAYTDYWTLPNGQDMNGRQQATVPPFPGTVQLWNQILNTGLPAGGGGFRAQLNRMGNQLRTIILVTKANGVRSDTPFPNPFNLRWDDVILRGQDPQTVRKMMKEYVNGLTARDTGVHVLPYSFGVNRYVGGNGVSSYLPTVTDTRFEVSGTFGAATAPTLDWLVNDVSAAPLSGIERTQVPGGTAYYPPAPAPAGNTM